jgi:hypothetical protein
MRKVDAYRALIDAAEAANLPAHLIKAASLEYWDIVDAPTADRRKVETYERGKIIRLLLKQGLTRAQICERKGWSIHQYYRGLGCSETPATSLELNRRNSNRSQRR